MPNEAASRDDLAQSINDLRVNWAALTPSVARILDPDALPTLEVLALVGEAAKAVDVATWTDRVRLLNAYGPAECAVVSTIRTRIDTASHSPANIGWSVAGATWLVDPNNHDKLAPIGSVGELLLEGPMVGRGYLDNPEQTAASFIPLPDWLRRLRPGKDGGRLYKTGDLARYSSAGDGSLDYIGRKDNQVKIRGQRIELGEIEYQVGRCLPPAADVLVDIVTPSDPNAQPLLVAFVWNGTPSEPQQLQDESDSLLFSLPKEDFQSTATRTELALRRSTLPRHMIPSLFILLRYLPLSPTGKANRRHLKERASSLSRRDLEQYRSNGTSSSPSDSKRPPSSETEGSVKKLVAHVLRLDPAKTGMDDHFFHLGGDSLSAMSISAQARRMGLTVKVADIFSHPQLSDLAAVVAGSASGKEGEHGSAADELPAPFSLLSPTEVLEKETIIRVAVEQCGLEGPQQIDDMYPCTPMQEGLFALTMQQSEAYITKQALILSENTDVARFQDAWRAVCEANPILRTRIVSIGADGHLYQVVVCNSSSSTVHGAASASSEDHESFTVRLGGPLFSIQTISMPQNRYQVVLSLHHSIYDGISMKLILDQL